MALIAVFTTVATRQDAERLARLALDQRLAACVQISAIDSHYRWRGQVQHDSELRLLFKTGASQWPALQRCLLEHHPYQLPAVYALPVSEASEAYAAWVGEELGPD
jgi:periplasmic divalent cation tolerance protein